MRHWLTQHGFLVEINWIVFVLAGVLALLIALATASLQSFKASLMNPVDSL